MIEIIKHWFTEADNVTFCIVRAIGGTASVTMIGKFIAAGAADFQGFAVGIASICAAVALKNSTEQK